MIIFTYYFSNNNVLKDLKIDTKTLKDHVSYSTNIIVNHLSPRYIITSTEEDFYYERVPFINPHKYLTRYIHLANVYNRILLNL